MSWGGARSLVVPEERFHRRPLKTTPFRDDCASIVGDYQPCKEEVEDKDSMKGKCYYDTLVYTCNHSISNASITHTSNCPVARRIPGINSCSHISLSSSIIYMDNDCSSCLKLTPQPQESTIQPLEHLRLFQERKEDVNGKMDKLSENIIREMEHEYQLMDKQTEELRKGVQFMCGNIEDMSRMLEKVEITEDYDLSERFLKRFEGEKPEEGITRKTDKEDKFADAKMEQSSLMMRDVMGRAEAARKTRREMVREREAREAGRKAVEEEFLSQNSSQSQKSGEVADFGHDAEDVAICRKYNDEPKRVRNTTQSGHVNTRQPLFRAEDSQKHKSKTNTSSDGLLFGTGEVDKKEQTSTSAFPLLAKSNTTPRKASDILKSVYEKDSKFRMTKAVPPPHLRPENVQTKPAQYLRSLYEPRRSQHSPKSDMTVSHPNAEKKSIVAKKKAVDVPAKKDSVAEWVSIIPRTTRNIKENKASTISHPAKETENEKTELVPRPAPTKPTPVIKSKVAENIEIDALVKGEKEEDWEDIDFAAHEARDEEWEMV